MPIADTPFEQLVVAVATYWTEEVTVELLVGALTYTPANADVAANTASRERQYSLILRFLQLFL
jgi:hypothetical protein